MSGEVRRAERKSRTGDHEAKVAGIARIRQCAAKRHRRVRTLYSYPADALNIDGLSEATLDRAVLTAGFYRKITADLYRLAKPVWDGNRAMMDGFGREVGG